MFKKGFKKLPFMARSETIWMLKKNCGKLLRFFRTKSLPVFHVKHNSSNIDSPLYPNKIGNDFHPEARPLISEPVFEKNVNSAFIGTNLEVSLKAKNITDVVIAGLTIEHCISTSVRMASNLGFNVILVSDATAAFDKIGYDGNAYSAEVIFHSELANLKDEFATIMDTDTLLGKIELNI